MTWTPRWHMTFTTMQLLCHYTTDVPINTALVLDCRMRDP